MLKKELNFFEYLKIKIVFNIDKILFLFNNFNIINKNFKKNEKLFFMLYEISEFKQMY